MTDTKTDDLPLVTRGRIALLALAPVLVIWTGLMLSPIEFRRQEAWLALAVVAVPVLVAAMTLSAGSAHRWAHQRGADFESPELSVLSRHLVRTRVARTLGVTLGFGASIMLLAHYNADPEAFPWYIDQWSSRNWMWPSALGYVAATIATELTKASLSAETAPRTALLARRRLGEFLDPFISRALLLTGASGLVLTGLGAMVATGRRGWSVSGARFDAAMLAVTGLLALGAAVVIAHRRSPAADKVALAYEELTSTGTINALAGTAAALFLFYGLEALWLAIGPTAPVASGVGFVGWLFGLSLWLSSGTSLVFRSRRLDRIRGTA